MKRQFEYSESICGFAFLFGSASFHSHSTFIRAVVCINSYYPYFYLIGADVEYIEYIVELGISVEKVDCKKLPQLAAVININEAGERGKKL